MKKTAAVVLLMVLCAGGCAARSETSLSPAPSRLPATDRLTNRPGFWTSRLAGADELILSRDEIKTFNQSILSAQLTRDIFVLPETIPGKDIRGAIDAIWSDVSGRQLWNEKGNPAGEDKEFRDRMFAQAAANMVPETVTPEYGLIAHYTDQRFLPTEQPLYAKAFDIDFDELQNSTLDVGTPVALLHKSADHRWYYVRSAQSDGWVKADDVVIGPRDDVKGYAEKGSFIVATAPKADIFLNHDMTQFHDYVRMGSRLPVALTAPGKARVLLPMRADDGKLKFVPGYMHKEEVREGYLPYTQANILRQAFLLLNAPYGWGGMYGEQDCSAFLHEVFGTVGIFLPRDSKDQAKAGKGMVGFGEKNTEAEKIVALQKAVPGATILPMKGHIMLYLGSVEGRPYAIHATWAYREPGAGDDNVRVLNRVVVSDLSLGEGSKRGSLLQRLSDIRELK